MASLYKRFENIEDLKGQRSLGTEYPSRRSKLLSFELSGTRLKFFSRTEDLLN